MEGVKSSKKARSKRRTSSGTRMANLRACKKKKTDEISVPEVDTSSDSEDDIVLSKLTGKSTSTATASSRKLSHVNMTSSGDQGQGKCAPTTSHASTSGGDDCESELEGYRIVDIKIIRDILSTQTLCSQCNCQSLTLSEVSSAKAGLVSRLVLSCDSESCDFSHTFYTSSRVKKQVYEKDGQTKAKVGKESFDLNARMVLGFRDIGKGLSAMEKFCAALNMPPPMAKKAYNELNSKLETAAEKVAEESMSKATAELKKMETENSPASASADDPLDTIAMFDGTWQKRGHSSLTGAVTCISPKTGKIMDIHIMNKTCPGCKEKDGMDVESPEYMNWYAEHYPKCKKNYTGSAPAMEPEGVKQMFNRSISKHNIRYTKYIGDGDTKSFKIVSDSKPYGEDVTISKLECVGHVQKRMGKNLRELKKNCGSKKLDDGKTIGGVGRLTNKEIDQLQIYYGLAIRRNKGSVGAMKNDIKAILHHRRSTDAKPKHEYCPKGEESWCGYQRDISTESKAMNMNIHTLSQNLLCVKSNQFLTGCQTTNCCKPVLMVTPKMRQKVLTMCSGHGVPKGHL